jgi:Styrene monooxygenase A putative substrate binding domain
MRKVLIVGAGQSGLQLALMLREHDYDVTVMSARTPEEILEGRVMSTQAMFHSALQLERDHRLNLWEAEASHFDGIAITVPGPDGARALDWFGYLDHYGQSIDQRVKMAGWLELFEERGGKVIIHGVTTSDLDSLNAYYDLVIVAAGKGELVAMFDRDPERSPFSAPRRALALAYVHGLAPRPEHPGVRFNICPGVGELFTIPALTLSGNCDILLFEGVPGGPFDAFGDRPGPAEHLSRLLDLMKQYLPWDYERCAGVELTDARATLVGGFAPTVRRPVAELPSGGLALGLADVVVVNDPITGQGSNSAAKCAVSYLESILARGDEPFDRNWMTATFERYWEYAQYVTTWTNALLGPLPEHALQVLGAAQTRQVVADRFINDFDNPPNYWDWFMDPAKAAAYLATV